MTRAGIPLGSWQALQPGAAAGASSNPVVLANENVQDYFITGGATRSALNDNLLAASGSAAIDTLSPAAGYSSMRSIYVQIIGSSGIASGQVILEGSNDNTTFFGMPWWDQTSTGPNTTNTAFSVAASTNRFFAGLVTYRYIRIRISTAFSGGTVAAVARLSPVPFTSPFLTQATASNLKTVATPTPSTAGGNAMYTAAVTNTAAQVKSGAGQVYSYDIHNPNAAISYVSFYNTAVGSVTVGTTAQVRVVGVPANARAQGSFDMGLPFSTAIVVASTTTRGGNTAPGTAVDVNIDYT